MRVPLEWLQEFTAVSVPAEDVARKLLEVGLETNVERGAVFPDHVVTARIVRCEKHPRADRLTVCAVEAGEGRERVIVCGAPNARVGITVPLAKPGADLGGGLQIAPREMRGVMSEGMLCSAKELGISSDAAGLYEFPEGVAVGIPLGQAFSQGPVLVTEPSSNRSDWLSIEGTARELAAALGTAFQSKPPVAVLSLPASSWSTQVEDAKDCPRYCGRVLEGIVVGPSPEWMTRRLEACGIRPLSNVVDVTNYVLLEYGQPLHAFDADKLTGHTVRVRRARTGERLTTLDEKERELGPAVLVITDESGPIALAGIMGGDPTAVGPATRRIFLEGAVFGSSRVRQGARALRMATDASHRFERGVDVARVPQCLDRAIELLRHTCPELRLVGAVDSAPGPAPSAKVTLTQRNARRILGLDLSHSKVTDILVRLGFVVESQAKDSWTVLVPSFRRDVRDEEDLIEEIARLGGLDQLPERQRMGFRTARVAAPRWEVSRASRRILRSVGLTEVVTPGLIDGARQAGLVPKQSVFGSGFPLRNPLSADRSHLRGTIVLGLLDVLAHNRAQGRRDLAIFEVGRVFSASVAGPPEEHLHVGILLSGWGLTEPWLGASKCSDFFDMKGILEVYVERLCGSEVRATEKVVQPLSTERCAEFSSVHGPAGCGGELGVRVRQAWDLPADLPVVWAELSLEGLRMGGADGRPFEPLPKFPGAVRDLALVVRREVRHEDLERSIRELNSPLLEAIKLFDVYEGPPLAGNEKSLAYTIVFRSKDRSLTNEEVDANVASIVERVERQWGARLR